MQTITTPAGIYTPPATALIQKVQLRIFESCPSATLCLMQYDRALPVIAVELFEGGNPYKVPENAAVNIRMVKPDKTTVYNPALGVSSDRKTTYIGITPQMTACFGSCAATLEIALNDGVLGTGLLRLNIEKNPVSEDAVESSDEYLSLQEIVNKVQTYADQASTAAESAEAAADLAMDSVQAVVSVNAQNFTKEQKAQARANIGAAASDEVGALPDWAQNDPTAAGYIKNRPVYLAAGKVLAKEQEVMVANDELCAPVEGDFTLEPGRMYKVFFEGEPYDCFAYTASVSGRTVLGNLGVNPDAKMEGENKGSGEPFALITGTGGVWLYTEEQGEFRIKIVDPNGVGDRVVIAEEYRDVLGVQSDWNQDDPTKTAYIRNRPFYIEPGAVLVKEQVVETDDVEFSGKIAGSVALEVGKQYEVIFEGKPYKCTAYETSDTGDTALGNLDVNSDAAIFGDNMGADEPFAIIYIENSGLWLYTEKAGSYTVEIVDPTAEGERVVIDKRFVGMLGGGQADWNQNDATAPDYIKNRPFYTVSEAADGETIREAVNAEEHEGYDGAGIGYFAGLYIPEAGRVYDVLFDGTKYKCRAYEIKTNASGTYTALGDRALATMDIPDTVGDGEDYGNGEPFAVLLDPMDTLTLYTSEPGVYDVEIAESANIVPLDEKYLPESVVRTGEQSFSAAQKAQARKNIGALGAGEVKSAYETAQEGGYLGTEEEFAVKLATDFIDWFGVGSSIPEGADLNTYKTNGKYYASSESRAKTLLNRPNGMNTNFCMWVFQRTTSTIYSQLLLTLHGKLYFRSSNSSKWNAWVEYTTSDEIEALTQQVKAELLKAVGKPDWMQNDPAAAGYIENRPFYVTDETAETTAEEQVVDVPNALYEGEICGTVEMAGLLEENQVYEVTFNGVKYRCTAYECAEDDYVILGNTDINADISMLDIENKGNGEPFCILHGSATSTTQLYTETVGEYLISIRRLKVMRLEEKFMPESVDGVVLRSSTPFSEKKFRITVNDNGVISATPV